MTMIITFGRFTKKTAYKLKTTCHILMHFDTANVSWFSERNRSGQYDLNLCLCG